MTLEDMKQTLAESTAAGLYKLEASPERWEDYCAAVARTAILLDLARLGLQYLYVKAGEKVEAEGKAAK